jgi:hypothetical protein
MDDGMIIALIFTAAIVIAIGWAIGIKLRK